MAHNEKTLQKVLSGTSDKNIRFEDLCQMLRSLDFEERIRGSHHIFRRDGVQEKINLQKDEDKAKPYQVRQVRRILLSHHLGEQANG